MKKEKVSLPLINWLKANPDSDFLLPEEVVDKTIAKYKEAYELLTGKEFE